MKLGYQIISVFSSKQLGYTGNPSAVLLLKEPLSNQTMQAIARKLDQPASTFLYKREGEDGYDIKWFAPDAEIGLCGHGTAAATAYLAMRAPDTAEFLFHYTGGELEGVVKDNEMVSISTEAIPVVK
ncbi:PhzF family phenazine biosynthesis protein, partial [Echinicola sediminis]